LAASTTDLIQSIVMTIALIVVLGYGTHMAGGFDTVADNAKSLSGYLSLHATHNAVTGSANNYGIITILSTLAWGLGYFGMPHILLRFMAIGDEKKLVLSRRIASTWAAVSMALSIVIGVVGLAMTKAGAIVSLTGNDSETIIVKISALLSSHGVLTAAVAGLILAGILAATMSTSDSQLLAAASSVSQNLLVDFGKVKMNQKKSLTIARTTVILISLIAVVIARDPSSSVFGIVSFAWAGFGAAFGPVVLLALFWKRSNKNGAVAGMVIGGAMVFIWKYLVRPLGGGFDIYELLPAFIIALFINVIVSFCTKAPEDSIINEYENAVGHKTVK